MLVQHANADSIIDPRTLGMAVDFLKLRTLGAAAEFLEFLKIFFLLPLALAVSLCRI